MVVDEEDRHRGPHHMKDYVPTTEEDSSTRNTEQKTYTQLGYYSQLHDDDTAVSKQNEYESGSAFVAVYVTVYKSYKM